MFRLLCFGYPRLERPDGRLLEGLQSHPKRFAVLIYLACHSETLVCQRDSLLPVFWPEADETHARNSLRQTLHVLRTFLGNDVVRCGGGGEVRLDTDRLTSDVRLFCRAVREGSLVDARAFPAEPFLKDFFVPDTRPFMDWVDERRFSLREKALYSATRLARKAEEGRDPHGAVIWWHRALDLSPYDEGVMANLVSALARSGNRGGALAEYRRFRDRMERDLDLKPSSTTQLVVDQALCIAESSHGWKTSFRRGRSPGGQGGIRTRATDTSAGPVIPGG